MVLSRAHENLEMGSSSVSASKDFPFTLVVNDAGGLMVSAATVDAAATAL
jgi:hypothetical protein